MLCNLKAELVRKRLDPVKAITAAIGCTDKTARNKLHSITDITVSEAVRINNTYFQKDKFEFEYLFAVHPQQTKEHKKNQPKLTKANLKREAYKN